MERDAGSAWWLTALVVAGLGVAAAASGQTVPEAVRPPGGATIPPSTDGTVLPAPRSENPAVEPGARPIPDRGVIVPPPTGASTPVVRPPATGPMPVIPAPRDGIVPK